MKEQKEQLEIKEGEIVKKKKIKLIVCVVVVAIIIFLLWLLTLPLIFSDINNNKDGEQKSFLNDDAKEILTQIKEAFGTFGKNLEETINKNTATSTEDNQTVISEEAIDDETILKLKEKILNQEEDEQ